MLAKAVGRAGRHPSPSTDVIRRHLRLCTHINHGIFNMRDWQERAGVQWGGSSPRLEGQSPALPSCAGMPGEACPDQDQEGPQITLQAPYQPFSPKPAPCRALPSENPLHASLGRALVVSPVSLPTIQPLHSVALPPQLSSHMAQRRARGPSLASWSPISVVQVWACGSSLANGSPRPPPQGLCYGNIRKNSLSVGFAVL